MGGLRSARGVIGNWFDKDYDIHGPAGPTAFWKVSNSIDQARTRDPDVDGLDHHVVGGPPQDDDEDESEDEDYEPGNEHEHEHIHLHHHHHHDDDEEEDGGGGPGGHLDFAQGIIDIITVIHEH